jgi:hypothetical protein
MGLKKMSSGGIGESHNKASSKQLEIVALDNYRGPFTRMVECVSALKICISLVLDQYPDFKDAVNEDANLSKIVMNNMDSRWLKTIIHFIYTHLPTSGILSDEELSDDGTTSTSYLENNFTPLLHKLIDDYEIMLSMTALLLPPEGKMDIQGELLIPLVNPYSGEPLDRDDFLYECRFDYLTSFHMVRTVGWF